MSPELLHDIACMLVGAGASCLLTALWLAVLQRRWKQHRNEEEIGL